MKNNPILILSGPSGAGKSTLCKKLFEKITNYYFSISTTTRDIRKGETHGKDYYFISKDEFKKSIENDEFLEWAEVHGNYYGTSKVYISQALSDNKLVVLDIDVQGQKNIIKKISNTISIFITTSNLSSLRTRLENRKTDEKHQIEKRLNNATKELSQIKNYDFLLINENLEKTFQEFYQIVLSIQHSIPRDLDIDNFVSEWEI